MNRPKFFLLLSLAVTPLAAQANVQGFDNFLLESPSIISPSQLYQVKEGRVESLLSLGSGSIKSNNDSSTVDIKAQSLEAGFAQSLSNSQLILAVDVNYSKQKFSILDITNDSQYTKINPSVAFNVNSIFSLGAAAHFYSGEEEVANKIESNSYQTFQMGGTLHQDLWEASISLITKNKDDKKDANTQPQELKFHGRYKILSVLALGIRFDQLDYPGVAKSTENLETESSYSIIAESTFSDVFRTEIAIESLSNLSGEKASDAKTLYFGGQYRLATNMDLGGILQMRTGDSDSVKYNLNNYSVTFTARM